MNTIDHLIPNAIVKLKANYFENGGASSFSELVPDGYSQDLPIEDRVLRALHQFADRNPIFVNSFPVDVDSVHCHVYEADVNGYWLSSKKHDACYQPFYPTWLLSAYALVREANLLGYEQIVDIGSGDGRISYCGSLMGMDSFGVEIDGDLVSLQRAISESTDMKYTTIQADATKYDYHNLGLTKPMFYVSGLPEMGEMLALGVIERVISDEELGRASGFNFMGSHVMKALSRDHTSWGWGSLISRFGLEMHGTITLPTYWTTEQSLDTAYVFTSTCRQR